jgi:hypothetical protein
VEHESQGGLSPAEQLPALYRAVLDNVAELEHRGERLEASRFRTEAIRAYSRSWDARGRRRLESILRRAERAVAVTPAVVLEPVTEPAPEEAPAPNETVKRRVSTAI